MRTEALERKSVHTEERQNERLQTPAPFPGAAPAITPRSFRNIPLHPQTKLTVNTPGDEYEQEADRTADEVMTMRDPDLQQTPDLELQNTDSGANGSIQRSSTGDPENEDVSGIVSEGLSGGGEPLDAETRNFMEPRLGFSFDHVRIHTNPSAAQSSEKMAARAYAVGSDIAFQSGQYNPHTSEGKRLLAHELTHVVQQTGAA